MEEQKLRMKPALLLLGRNNTNVQRIINWTAVNWFGVQKIYILKNKRINMKVWKKKKLGDWVETKKADVLGAQIII